jgi:hypothetical protein
VWGLSVIRSPETRAISSTANHTYYLTFLYMGLDLVGPFKKAKGGFTHIFIWVDKFTKWIEVKPVASITVAQAVEFIKEIMYKFGVPNNIITDNWTQFTVREFKEFCAVSGSVTPAEQWSSGSLKWHDPSRTEA